MINKKAGHYESVKIKKGVNETTLYCFCPKCGTKSYSKKEVITKITINSNIYCIKCERTFCISMLKK